MKKKPSKIPRRKYPTAREIKAASLQQLKQWLDTLTYPGHGINSAKQPRKFAIIQAAERKLRTMIFERVKNLKKGELNGINT